MDLCCQQDIIIGEQRGAEGGEGEGGREIFGWTGAEGGRPASSI